MRAVARPPVVGQSTLRPCRQRLELEAHPLAVLRAVRDEPRVFALTGRWGGGGAVIGANPTQVRRAPGDPLALLDAQPSLGGSSDGIIGGGWFGHLGYGLGAAVERLPPRPPRLVPIPDWQLAHYDHLLRLDADGIWWLESLDDPRAPALQPRVDRLLRCLDAMTTRRRGSPPLPADTALSGPRFTVAAPGRAGHEWAVAEAVKRIHAGELFQVNLGLRLNAHATHHPVDSFIAAASRLEPAYGAVFADTWGGLVSLSPELFLRRTGARVVSGPIKGTVPRDTDPTAADLRGALRGSAKDGAEHVMIVDLMRNDLGRVCEFASVVADPAPRIEPHPGVWHLVSDVSGELRPGVGDGELLRATFPPGSVTGAPKVQSMKLISQLEGSGRELYTGCLGFASPCAGLELSVGIRTFESSASRIWLGAGGGIVADSNPAAELAEALSKATPLIKAIGGTIAPDERGRPRLARRPPLPWSAPTGGKHDGTDPVPPRPDPQRGVMETIRVRDSEPVALDAHRARLAGSLEHCYARTLPADFESRARGHAAGAGDAKLRVLAVPNGNSVALRFELGALPAPVVEPIELVPVTVPGGLGDRKWADRRLLEALTRRLGGVPLIVDSDGDVLEAAWANVWCEIGGRLHTPPADGRILPGTARARLIHSAAAAGTPCRVAALSLADLERGELTLTSALRSGVPAVLRSAAGLRGARVPASSQ